MSDALFDVSGERVELTSAGASRRADIGALLGREAARRKRRRSAARGAAVALPVIALSAGAWIALSSTSPSPAPSLAPAPAPPLIADASPAPAPSNTPAPVEIPAPSNAVESPARPRVAMVETDPAILDRYTVRPSLSRVEYIGDAELSRLLAAAGHDPGVIRTRDRVIVVAAAELGRGRGAERR